MAQQLLEGFLKFRQKEYEGRDASMPKLVVEGQSPEFFIISCIDSRSNPGTIFQPTPGTFLAHKAMGAIVRPYKKGTALSAALQFALVHNKVGEIIILGHTGCGAIKALISGLEDEEISSFMDVTQSGMNKARHKCGDHCSSEQLHRYAEEEIVLVSAENLKTYPSVARALGEGRVKITPWLFDMETGNLFEYSAAGKKFEPITDH